MAAPMRQTLCEPTCLTASSATQSSPQTLRALWVRPPLLAPVAYQVVVVQLEAPSVWKVPPKKAHWVCALHTLLFHSKVSGWQSPQQAARTCEALSTLPGMLASSLGRPVLRVPGMYRRRVIRVW